MISDNVNVNVDVAAELIAADCTRLETLLAEKGYPRSSVQIEITSDNNRFKGLIWYPKFDKPTAPVKELNIVYAKTYKSVMEQMIDFIDKLPSEHDVLETALRKHVSAAIELSQKIGVDAEIVNPLKELMKKLSSNILTKEVKTVKEDS